MGQASRVLILILPLCSLVDYSSSQFPHLGNGVSDPFCIYVIGLLWGTKYDAMHRRAGIAITRIPFVLLC